LANAGAWTFLPFDAIISQQRPALFSEATLYLVVWLFSQTFIARTFMSSRLHKNIWHEAIFQVNQSFGRQSASVGDDHRQSTNARQGVKRCISANQSA
jgi:hypothetical protein